MCRIGWLLLLCTLACGVPTPPDVDQLSTRARDGDSAAVAQLLELLTVASPPAERTRLYRALLEVPRPAAGPILAACDSSDPVRREHALALAGNMRLQGTAEAALRTLGDSGFPRRYVAAWALGELGDPAHAPALVTALSQGDPLLAREAARALVKLGRSSAVAVLGALSSLEPIAAGYAVRVLGEVGEPRAAEALVAALERPELRADAVWALGNLGVPDAGPLLLPRLSDPDWRVRLELCRALGLLQFSAADPDLDRLRHGDPVAAVREWAARSLALLRGTPQTFLDARGEERVPGNLYR
ncbi:MAG TPA: HEAT repeat domain-containing protein [Deferrisomatales bacterium]|nr:HEAT repeat domain-containing protein [Deferrisomatales bacterium]